jgi:GAF domain-containing protein
VVDGRSDSAFEGDRLSQLGDVLARLRGADPQQLVIIAGAALPSARHACLSAAAPDERLQTLGCTDPLASDLDARQFAAGEGPCLDVIEHRDLVEVADLEVDLRWPTFARQAVDLDVRSVLGVCAPVSGLGRAALTFYADEPDAFDPADRAVATILGAFVGVALESEQLRQRVANLEIALATNRHIGTAIGIVMARELLTPDQAFDRLRSISQRRRRKLRDVADEVVRTGEVPDAP